MRKINISCYCWLMSFISLTIQILFKYVQLVFNATNGPLMCHLRISRPILKRVKTLVFWFRSIQIICINNRNYVMLTNNQLRIGIAHKSIKTHYFFKLEKKTEKNGPRVIFLFDWEKIAILSLFHSLICCCCCCCCWHAEGNTCVIVIAC